MLAIVPVRDGVLPAGAAEAVAECDGRVLVVGSGAAHSAFELIGVRELQTLELPSIAPASTARHLVEFLADEPVVVLPGSPDGRDLAPRLAHLLRRSFHGGAVEIQPDRVRVARRGGLVIEEIRPTGAFVATLQPGIRGVDPDSTVGSTTRVELHPTPNTGAKAVDAELLEVLPPDVSTMDLTESPRILGGGAGLDSAQRFAQLADIAARLDGSMGATRVITDRAWVGHERQIGTTGVIIDPSLYLAFGISGAVQHTSGLGSPDHIISVNTDPHCPMMQMADLAITSDANAVLDELQRLLAGSISETVDVVEAVAGGSDG
jgi:electron transfer flavoprotein alpha subunit